jgi:hypothetical protein
MYEEEIESIEKKIEDLNKDPHPNSIDEIWLKNIMMFWI